MFIWIIWACIFSNNIKEEIKVKEKKIIYIYIYIHIYMKIYRDDETKSLQSMISFIELFSNVELFGL